MLEDGERLVPGFKQSRALRVWTGVRPLFEDHKEDAASTRDVTRSHALLDHAQRDGVGGFVTITGGKLTTYRLMAEQTVDARLPPARRAATVHDRDRAARSAQRTASLLPRRRSARAGARRASARRPARLRVRADPAAAARGGDARARDVEPRRHPAHRQARDGAVPGRVLHLPRDRDPARRSTGSRRRRRTPR